MGTPPYIMSHVMLEEHRLNAERAIPNPDWPDPVPAHRPDRFAGLRQRAIVLLRSIADRLDAPENLVPRSQGASSAE